MSVENGISYVAPVALGNVLTAVATEEGVGGRLAFYRVTVRNQHDAVVALFRGTVYRTKRGMLFGETHRMADAYIVEWCPHADRLLWRESERRAAGRHGRAGDPATAGPASGARPVADHRMSSWDARTSRARTTATWRGWHVAGGASGVGARRDRQPAVRLGIERGRDMPRAASSWGRRRLHRRGRREHDSGALRGLEERQGFARDAQLFDTSIGWRFVNPRMRQQYGVDAMGETAENVAADFHVSRRIRIASRA